MAGSYAEFTIANDKQQQLSRYKYKDIFFYKCIDYFKQTTKNETLSSRHLFLPVYSTPRPLNTYINYNANNGVLSHAFKGALAFDYSV